ncbi:MAG: class I SAM-dependent methyltransferase [Bacteroidia bacterium]|nr:class I SAM-dependent methyltransferase [Bacteroidia bacterium]
MKLIKKIKTLLRKTGLFGKSAKAEYIQSSQDYWERRYIKNKNSGAGSYGRLADFKAELINDFVATHNIYKVIELGCGDGNQLQLAEYPQYIGFDVSKKAIDLCWEMFADDDTKQFFLMDEDARLNEKADLSISLDVIYHLIEDEVFENYMNRLFNCSNRYVIIYSSNYDGFLAKHVMSRKFTDWITEHVSQEWHLKSLVKNRFPFDKSDPDNTSISDFYIYEKINLK